MKETMDEIDEPVDDEEVVDDDAEPSESELADATVPPDPAAVGAGAEVESIQELLVKQEAADEEDADEDEVVVPLTREEKTTRGR